MFSNLIPRGFPLSIDVFCRIVVPPILTWGRRERNEPSRVATLSYSREPPFSAPPFSSKPDNDGYIIHGWLHAIPRNPRKPSSRFTDQTLLCFFFFSFFPATSFFLLQSAPSQDNPNDAHFHRPYLLQRELIKGPIVRSGASDHFQDSRERALNQR